ncbi:DUF1877 family protein [Rhodocytophaga rosea]|uniref:DUF1877 family protein n=1 Tax=Rhodocytophaga rosea TaxID=2704465 RepID=A0A6C0GQJ0_9BACT|nr:YfbM family protein [Rhodocytophaga rosea]QHT69832.1 DUF1877 family protein [Rhodocytophaga rosea]
MLLALKAISEDELEALKLDSSPLTEDYFSGQDSEDELWLDKFWDILQFLIAHDRFDFSSIPGKVVQGGEPIDEELDLGYGPALYVTADEVKNIKEYLSSLKYEELVRKFDAEVISQEEIYPYYQEFRKASAEEIQEEISYCLAYVDKLKEFYRKAADKNFAVIKELC